MVVRESQVAAKVGASQVAALQLVAMQVAAKEAAKEAVMEAWKEVSWLVARVHVKGDGKCWK